MESTNSAGGLDLVRNSTGDIAHHLASAEGVRQGDPMAPLLFALSMHSIYGAVEAAGNGQVKLVAVHDDLTIIGPPAVALQCHDTYKRLAASAGLHLQAAKSQALWLHGAMSQDHALALDREGIPIVRNAIVLGSPIGDNPDQLQQLARAELEPYKDFFTYLVDPEFTHMMSTQLLRSSGIPRMNYMLRTTPPAVTFRLAQEFETTWYMCCRGGESPQPT